VALRDCLAELVAKGKITKTIAAEALSFNERIKGEYSRHAPPATNEAVAALQAAKTLREYAAAKIRNINANLTVLQTNEKRIMEHPMGRGAAVAGINGRDLYTMTKGYRDLPADHPVKAGPNVEAVRDSVTKRVEAIWREGLEAFKTPGLRGLNADRLVTLRNFIHETFGVDTGDKLAKSIAQNWAKATDYLVDRAQKGGKLFDAIENWRLPQHWEQWRVANIGQNEFIADFMAHVQSGALNLFDRENGRMAITEKHQRDILTRAFDDISNKGGPSAPFSRESRTFNFTGGKAGAEAYMQLMEKYGYGNNPVMTLSQHLKRAANEIGLIESWGPNHDHNFAAAMNLAERDWKTPTTAAAVYNPLRAVQKFLETPNTVRGQYKVLNGAVHPEHDNFMSWVLAAARNISVATALRSAVIPVIAGDSITHLLAASAHGMPVFRHMAELFSPRGFFGNLSKADYAHLHLAANATNEFVQGFRDFEDHISVFQSTGKVASLATKASGLAVWGEKGKQNWGGSVLRTFAEHENLTYDQLKEANPLFHRAIDTYGIDAKDWDYLRSKNSDIGGARYADPNKFMDNERVYDKVMRMTQETGAFAMHQPDARIRSFESGLKFGAERGIAQQVAMAMFQYKTFGLSRLATQMMVVFADGDMATRAIRLTTYAAMSLVTGAWALQMLRGIRGKDMEPMDSFSFWGRAMVKGGLLGYWGEMLAQGMEGDRGLEGILKGAAGPIPTFGAELAQAAFAPIHEKFQEWDTGIEKPTHGRTMGATLRRIGEKLTPEQWWNSLAWERLLWDKVQMLIDPDWRKSFARSELRQQKEYKSGYWWAPGTSLPQRAPNVGHY